MDSSSIIIIFLIILIQLALYFFIIKKKKIFKFYEYNQIQKTHLDFTPRLGGLVIFIVFYLYLLIRVDLHSLNQLIVFLNGLMIIMIATKEDLYANVSPKKRFMTVLIASLLTVIFLDKLPNIEFYLVEEIFKNKYITVIFYTLCIALITNGINIIDGLNGHASLSLISSLICLIYLNDFNLNGDSLPFILLIFLIVFIFFNFPFGSIFLGDAGAYWLGWITSILIINFFAYNSEINSWLAVVILFYPAMEVLFSFTRKLILKKSPFQPDLNHIHLKIYHLLKSSRYANPLSTILLMPLTIFPIGYVYCAINFNISIIFILALQIIIYLTYYVLLPKPKFK